MRKWLWPDWVALSLLLAYVAWAFSLSGERSRSAPLDPVLAAAQQRGTLRIAVDPGFAPFADQSADGELFGYDIEVATMLSARLGLQPEFVPTGYDALYDALVGDQADVVIAALPYAPERGGQARFSQFYADAGLMLVVQNDQPAATVEQLAGQPVGAILGSDADLALRRLAQTNGLVARSAYDDATTLLADLAAGRLAAIIVDNIVAIQALNSGCCRRLSALSFEPYVIAMPQRAFQLQLEIDQILGDLRRNGFFEELERRRFVLE